MMTQLAAALVPAITHARETVATTDTLDDAVDALAAEIEERGDGHVLAALALIQLAGDEDYAGVTR